MLESNHKKNNKVKHLTIKQLKTQTVEIKYIYIYIMKVYNQGLN
jgi:hypothetical protein